VAARQLLPKHFPFLSLEEHQEILRLLENGGARAVIAATGIDPEMAGGLAPFPLIEDGDFLLPHAYLAEADAAGLPECAGEQAVLEIRARRTLAEGCNVTARCGETSAGRLIVTAHFDAKPGSPGALDNAGGVVVLLLLAILLRDYRAAPAIELVAINGEDYYSSPGELCFLAENADGLDDVLLGINIDGVGLKNAKTAFSLYDCPPPATSRIRGAFRTTSGLQEGPAWYQGDHALFLQHGRPALALTTADSGTLFAVAHTAEDRPELIDPAILVRTARALHALLESFSAPPHKRV
jgi:aminopeptidase YwaD